MFRLSDKWANHGDISDGGRAERKKKLLLRVTALEALDAAGGVHVLLLAGEERMAVRADSDAQILARGAGLKHGPASAGNRRLKILRMDFGFHCKRGG